MQDKCVHKEDGQAPAGFHVCVTCGQAVLPYRSDTLVFPAISTTNGLFLFHLDLLHLSLSSSLHLSPTYSLSLSASFSLSPSLSSPLSLSPSFSLTLSHSLHLYLTHSNALYSPLSFFLFSLVQELLVSPFVSFHHTVSIKPSPSLISLSHCLSYSFFSSSAIVITLVVTVPAESILVECCGVWIQLPGSQGWCVSFETTQEKSHCFQG